MSEGSVAKYIVLVLICRQAASVLLSNLGCHHLSLPPGALGHKDPHLLLLSLSPPLLSACPSVCTFGLYKRARNVSPPDAKTSRQSRLLCNRPWEKRLMGTCEVTWAFRSMCWYGTRRHILEKQQMPQGAALEKIYNLLTGWDITWV